MMDVTLSIHLKIPIYKLLKQFTSNQQVAQARIDYLVEIEDNRKNVCEHLARNKKKVKDKFYKKAQPRIFRKEDIVLMWDKIN
jgi:type III secretory pathway component EscR